MPRFSIATEATRWIAALLLLALATYSLGWWLPALVVLAIAGALGWLFRERFNPLHFSPLEVTAPCHGACVRSELDYDPWVERRARRIDIQIGLTSGYRFFAPIEAKIVDVRVRRSGRRSQRVEIWLRTDEGDDVVVRLEQNWPARFRLNYAPGERIGHGRAIGFAPFGGECSVWMPDTVEPLAEPGAEVEAPGMALARLLR
jgi:phosphatidylserine decarboxylase